MKGELLMKAYIKWMDGNSKLIKVILAFFIGIFWNIYRLFKSVKDNNILGVVLAIILLFTGGLFVLWIIDIITLIFMDKVLWF
jgi:preprotein translocase subunit SecY